MQHHVIVITHDCVGGDIDGVDAGQHQQAVFDPLPAMLETAAAVKVSFAGSILSFVQASLIV